MQTTLVLSEDDVAVLLVACGTTIVAVKTMPPSINPDTISDHEDLIETLKAMQHRLMNCPFS